MHRWSNKGSSTELVRCLNDCGYTVDFIDWRNDWWAPQREYDLFLGHGGVNFERISRHLGTAVPKVYYSTGSYWRYHTRRADERARSLAKRTGISLKPDRPLPASEEWGVRNSLGIIALGDDRIKETFGPEFNIYPVDNLVSASAEPWQLQAKEYDSGRKHFLFYAGAGNLHKGLDLLLEAFRSTKLHLHICQRLSKEFRHAFSALLFGERNIHYHGHLVRSGERMRALMNECNWILGASCSEGACRSVIECQAHGLIPLVTNDCTVRTGDWGLALPEDPSGIRATVTAAAGFDVAECRERSANSLRAVQRYYSRECYRKKVTEALLAILGVRNEKLA
jgi:glycosyltransferase involved in cell wall biosynthesis